MAVIGKSFTLKRWTCLVQLSFIQLKGERTYYVGVHTEYMYRLHSFCPREFFYLHNLFLFLLQSEFFSFNAANSVQCLYYVFMCMCVLQACVLDRLGKQPKNRDRTYGWQS